MTPPPTGAPSEDRFRDLLVAWEAARNAGREPTPDELCPDDPALRERLRNHLAATLPPDTSVTAGAADPPLAQPQEVGELGQLGGYRLLRLLGRGGMGAVYAAQDDALRRPIALKVMLPEVARRPEARERFLREARAAAAVRDDHVVTIYQVDEAGGVPFIAMEYLRGKSVGDWMRENRATVPQVLKIGYDTALGLAVAHATGLVHRDIKPANLWLEAPNGRVKILDFGLARSDGEDGELTGSGVVLGTPAYMAPEQARGLPVDRRCDLFSLGCVLYHLATGRRPFAGNDVYAILSSLAADTPAPAHELNPVIPPRLSALIDWLLRKRPEERPDSARVVADELRLIQRELMGGPVPVTEGVPEAVPVPDAPTAWEQIEVTGGPTADGPRRRERVWPLYAAAAGLVVLAGAVVAGVWSYVRPRDNPTVELVPEPVSPPVAKGSWKPAKKVAPFAPLDPEWEKRVGELSGREQLDEVVAELKRRNPDATELHYSDKPGDLRFGPNQKPARVLFQLNTARDLISLRVLKHVTYLVLYQADGIPLDTRPLAELKQLQWLTVHYGYIADCGPLSGLTELSSITGDGLRIDDPTPLKNLPIRHFNLEGDVTDVPRWLPLMCDWWPLEGLILRSRRAAIDLTPLRRVTTLRNLDLWWAPKTDLSPLAGLPIEALSLVDRNDPIDLSVTRDMPTLRRLSIQTCPSPDLASLVGSKITTLGISGDNNPGGSNRYKLDVTPIRGLGITDFSVRNTTVTDPAVLTDWPLEAFGFSTGFEPPADLLAVVRAHKTIKTINRTPAAAFWKEYDAKKP